jgi:AGZA family xanthine/uracil permease-like MFS transporter
MRLFVRGDIDGFFGLALDNLVQLLVIVSLCKGVLDFPNAILYDHVLPGAAVSLLVGNLFYSWQALRLARRTGRSDVCAQPYGINTVSLFAYVFLVMLPAKIEAKDVLHLDSHDAALYAWRAGLVACFACGLIEFLGSLVAQRIRKVTPRAALLATLSGIALGFISLGFLFRTFAHPIVGLTTLGIILMVYFGRVKFRLGIPGGLVAVALGTVLYWLGQIPMDNWKDLSAISWLKHELTPAGQEKITFHQPQFILNDLIEALRAGHLLKYLTVIIPMGAFTLLGSIQCIEAAEAAGDSYPERPSLMANGIGTMAAALFGSCFPTTIYIGHPGWKAMGARAGYSVLNGLFFTIVCLFGLLGYIAHWIPIDAGMAIVLWIGIVITAQAFQACPKEHAPAVVVGILPGVAAWGTLLMVQALNVAGYGPPGNLKFSEELPEKFHGLDNWIEGAFALREGFIFTSMILAAATVALIERKFVVAAIWCFVAAALACFGFIHSFKYLLGDTTQDLFHPAWPFVAGYVIMGTCFLLARWVTEPTKEGH